MADGGYDVSDYCDIDPRFGTLADADALLADAHRLGLRVIVDLVANHTSREHPWFAAALAAGPGSPERDRYFFRDGRAGGEEPPNDWISAFGGGAWTRVREPDGRPGQWYLHTFAPEQPDLDWSQDGRARGVRRRPAVLARPRGRRDPGGRGARPWPRCPGLPDAGHAPGRAVRVAHLGRQPALGRRHRARHPPAVAGHRGQLRRRPALRHRGRRPRPRTAQPLRAAGRDAHQLQLRLPDRAVGRRAGCAGSSTRASARWNRSAPRPPGCCPATTRRGTPPGSGGRTPGRVSAAPPSPRRPTDLDLGAPPGPGGRAAHPGAAGVRLPLPGGGARAAGGRGPARRRAPGPDVGALRAHRARPRRVPRAAAVGGGPPAVRFHPGRRRALAAAAAGLGGA